MGKHDHFDVSASEVLIFADHSFPNHYIFNPKTVQINSNIGGEAWPVTVRLLKQAEKWNCSGNCVR